MIAYVKGILSQIGEDYIIVENAGIGYMIRIPHSAAVSLPGVGTDVKIHTFTYVREDMFDLYGFLNQDDLYVFKLLIGVSGIGPKGALGILSALSADELRFCVLASDAKGIAKAPGIGIKTAQKLVIELKDKLKFEESKEEGSFYQTEEGLKNRVMKEAQEALTALGYSASEALRAIKKAGCTDEMTVEDLLRLSLKYMNES